MNTDYKKPIIYLQSDYRTSQSRGHRFLLSSERNFIPIRSHPLCDVIKNPRSDYRPKSESAKEFQWKINQYRNSREELAPALDRVRYIHQFSDKIKASEIIKPLNYCGKLEKDMLIFYDLPKDFKLTPPLIPPPIEYFWKETQFTNTPGYYPLLDGLVSTTEIDFHQHENYTDARTKLIPRVELPFNSSNTHYPLCDRKISNAGITRDVSKFKTPTFDRITITRVPYRGLKSEKMEHF